MFEENQKMKGWDQCGQTIESSPLTRILSALHNEFQAQGITIANDYLLTSLSIDEATDPSSAKSFKSVNRESSQHLKTLQELLTKQLANSVQVIINEVFDADLEEKSRESGTRCLIILQNLLRLESVRVEQSSKVLKWVYQLACVSPMELSMELSNVLTSIKKKLIKLGFSLLGRTDNQNMPQLSENSNLDEPRKEQQDQQQFKNAVENLIQSKEAQISGLKFQICRVCETFVPITFMASHLNQCEQIHQQQYLQSKLEDKGSKLLGQINQLPPHTEQRYNLRVFFDRIYTTIGDFLATFALKKSLKEITRVIEQYQVSNYEEEIYGQILQLLQSYRQCLQKDADCRDNLSDKDSKVVKSKHRRRNRCSIGSNTSLIPSFRTVEPSENSQSSQEQEIASSKTINTDTEAMVAHNCLRLSDFEVISHIGKGSYSEVFLVRKRNTKDLFAMKVIEIEDLDEQRVKAFKREQKIYKSITGGFNVKLYYSFGRANLYFLVLDYGCGGSLRQLLEKQVYLQEKYAKVYIANLILAVDSIHRMGIVHRDLKPDNIVINDLGQLILTDFNLSKLIIDRDNERSHTFFGTPDYIAPQVLRGETATTMIDYFSLGIIAYQMVIGVTPYTDSSVQAVFDNILAGKIEWPQVGNDEGQISSQCKDLLEKLLHPDPKKRLGANGITEFQTHPFFEGVNWNNISQCQFYYVPHKPTQYAQNLQILQYIEGKIREESEKAIEGQVVVRYDILKTITNKNLRSQRSSRFKLEKQLEALRLLPSTQSIKLRKHNSYNNFGKAFEDTLISCRDLYEESSPQQ